MTIATSIIGCGLLFDRLSLLFGMLGILKRAQIPGFPWTGAVCYLIGHVVLLVGDQSALQVSLLELGAALVVIHVVCQVPGFVVRRKYAG